MSYFSKKLRIINEGAKKEPEILIRESEQNFSNILEKAVERIKCIGGREIVMLAGPSASGKTTTANKIASFVENSNSKAYVVSLDDFYLNAGEGPKHLDGSNDFESIYSLDLPLINESIRSLLNGSTTEIPIFDFTKGKRSEKTKTVKLDEEDIVIIEGLHAINPLLTDNLPKDRFVKLYISISSRITGADKQIILGKRDMRFIRRLVRDYQFRNSSTHNTYSLWPGVMHGEERYLFPFRDNADMKLNSYHASEPCIFSKIAIPLLKEVDSSNNYYSNALELIESLKKFEELSSEMVPDDSLLREFLGPKKS